MAEFKTREALFSALMVANPLRYSSWLTASRLPFAAYDKYEET